ncbi:tetratricopeptide repeat protein [Pseudoduganella sp. UC29_106]|uniref:tetratricopeptide repeat protein n=1 Tax=Pseudoduganella sp. UC29_106 TaxID=3374553 RepID=UPI00375778DC
MKKAILISGASLLMLSGGMAQARQICGSLGVAHDVRDNELILQIVEGAHFTEEVEAGGRGTSGGLAAADIHYTLATFPNHRRALEAVIRMAPRYKGGTIPGMQYPSECYLERAVRFRPDDGIVWGLYGRYLYVMGKESQALPMFERAIALSPDDPAINYNIGLMYAKQKQYDKALPYAQKAYAAGFPLAGLKNMLVSARAWVEPPKSAAADAESAAPGAAAPAAAAAASSASTEATTKQ